MDNPTGRRVVRLVIELAGEDEPIEGALLEPASCASSFRGWLALATLIETVRKSPGSPDDARQR
jgi:hypothetical protein